MSIITFNNKKDCIVGKVTQQTPRALYLEGKFGPVIVPMAWISHVDHEDDDE